MGKETMKFTWGIILTLICGLGTSLHISEILNKSWDFNCSNTVLLILAAIGYIIGIIKIENTIK